MQALGRAPVLACPSSASSLVTRSPAPPNDTPTSTSIRSAERRRIQPSGQGHGRPNNKPAFVFSNGRVVPGGIAVAPPMAETAGPHLRQALWCDAEHRSGCAQALEPKTTQREQRLMYGLALGQQLSAARTFAGALVNGGRRRRVDAKWAGANWLPQSQRRRGLSVASVA